jgi:ornithine cyclodeaminase/alanine dehydrogenase-like protein (mu-crystallin family)
VIGTGNQARAQTLAVCAVRPIEEIRVHSRSAERAHAFARSIQEETSVRTTAALSAQACVREADVVVLITKATEPVVRSEWLSDGVHINAAGANAATRRELDAATVLRARVLATDDRSQAQVEAAEFRDLVGEGRLRWEDVHELGDLVTGAVRGRGEAKDVTLFKSLGVSLEDMAFAELIYRRALAKGVGREM